MKILVHFIQLVIVLLEDRSNSAFFEISDMLGAEVVCTKRLLLVCVNKELFFFFFYLLTLYLRTLNKTKLKSFTFISVLQTDMRLGS